jgi:branched-subunit amino acid transport protein
MSTWLILVAMGIVTYATRALPLLIPWRQPHPFLERVLHYMPPAIFAALIVPAILTPSGSWIEISWTLWAGLVGAVVAWRTRSMILTIMAGLGTFALAGLL